MLRLGSMLPKCLPGAQGSINVVLRVCKLSLSESLVGVPAIAPQLLTTSTSLLSAWVRTARGACAVRLSA